MKKNSNIKLHITIFLAFATLILSCDKKQNNHLKLNDQEYFQSRGLNVLVYTSWYNGLFSDEKKSGIELIHHEVRTATNGDVRLGPTPEQWDPIPTFRERKVDHENGTIEAFLHYPAFNFEYSVKVSQEGPSVNISVNLKNPVPEELIGKAGFNLEFIPPAYFEKGYLIDEKSGTFPLYPSSSMEIKNGVVDPLPLATGSSLVLSPEDPKTRVAITSRMGDLALYDGRDKAQNGWFVVRSLLPAAKTGKVLEWTLEANTIPGWTRPPVIGHSQQGYHPDQPKKAVVELDRNDQSTSSAKLIKIAGDGSEEIVIGKALTQWGAYLRYNYGTFDFTEIKENGLYVIEAGNTRTEAFKISADVYGTAWQPTLDIFFPVQMDHMFVNEAYRVWHGKSHMDDALQAPVDWVHFDLYAQGPTTDTPYQPGEHIPGLDIGGWYDAGDFDIRTQTQCYVVQNLVNTWEAFGLDRDQTSIDQTLQYVDIHKPDGKADLLQQIEHGTLALIAQHRAVGHAIHGIVAAHLSQYTHLGDGVTKTDNLIYTPRLDSFKTDGFRSGIFDDRWAFTSRTTPLNYRSIAALAAASRALKGYNDALADECLTTAINVWKEEHAKEPDLFHHGNTTGGALDDEELKAATQLLLSTRDPQYAKRISELWPTIDRNFGQHASRIAAVLHLLDDDLKNKIPQRVAQYKIWMDSIETQNPYGVPVTTGGWAGSGAVVGFGITAYDLHQAFPDIIGSEYVFKALNYLYGNHPGSDISLVSGVGTKSKKVAYGNNRADYSFIAGGVVPGVLILPPDFPENKEDWPFLWGENEYVVSVASAYLYLANAADHLSNKKNQY